MRKFVLIIFLIGLLSYIACNNNSNDGEGTYDFTITYHPDGGQAWSEAGTGTVVIDGNNVTINVKMTTGEEYVRKLVIEGNDVTIKGSYTQPVASNPDVNETATYDGTGTFDGEVLDASGTYTFTIPDWSLTESGTFELTATKK